MCSWIYNVMIVNNTLPEATVYIKDREAVIVWFLLKGFVILNKYLLCENGGRGVQKTKLQSKGKDVILLCERRQNWDKKNNVAWIIIAALIKVLKHAENAGWEHSCFICVCVNVHV